ncbi:FlaA1/EpsC-like NDP-sugar epimerase [Acholeplasma morum]|nr:FlaA1/EpsC-like NDP-sugar epimerase [Paracholeplasma morum]
MKLLRNFYHTYKVDHEKFSLIEQTLTSKQWAYYSLIPLFNLLVIVTPIVLIGVNLSIFIELQKPLVVLLAGFMVFVPYLYYYFKYNLIRHYQNSLRFVKINRLVLMKGTFIAFIVFLLLVLVLSRYWRFLP